jgi:hypothetical protein
LVWGSSFPVAEFNILGQLHTMESLDVLDELVFTLEGAILTRSSEAIWDTMTVVVFSGEEPSFAEDAFIGREKLNRGRTVEGHADPFTLADVLAFFMTFPGFFADGNTAECALEDLVRFLGWN